MKPDQHAQPQRWIIIFSTLVASALLLFALQSIQAEGLTPTDITVSEKTVNQESASIGSNVEYTIVISTQIGNESNVVMTDTLPAGVTYVADSLDVTGGGIFGESAGVITWSGGVNVGSPVVVTFDANVNGDVGAGEWITNTAMIKADSSSVEVSASFEVVSDTFTFFPFIMTPTPKVTLLSISEPNASNQWTLSYSVADDSLVTGYTIQESLSADFSSILNTYTTSDLSYDVTQILRIDNKYYYRVAPNGDWGVGAFSNVKSVIGGYRDDFQDPSSGWTMRREDTDHIENSVYYRDGKLVLEQDSSWDYIVAGPLVLGPAGDYTIKTRVRLFGVDNLHSYGLVFGGDWDGVSPCPNENFTSCFNNYYRIIVIWSGGDNTLKYQLKRIDFHDPGNNAGRGVDLISWTTVTVNEPSHTWQDWEVQVNMDGTIVVLVNGAQVGVANDTTYINNPYFGVFSATDEYNGLEAEFDWYQVTAR